MLKIILLSFYCFFGVILTSAQSSPEISQLLEQANKSLYENPENASRILQNVDLNKEPEIIQQKVQLILSKSYTLQGDFTESVDQTKQIKNNQNRQEIKSSYIDFGLARQYQSLGLYKQSGRISEKLISQILKFDSKKFENLAAQIYQLNAANFMILQNWKLAQQNLVLSNALLSSNESDRLIRFENQLHQTSIYISQNKLGDAEKVALGLTKDLDKFPDYLYFKAANLENQGRIQFFQKNYTKSVELLTRALSLAEKSSFLPLKNKIFDDLSRNYLALKEEVLYQKFHSDFKESEDRLDQNKKEAIRHLILLNDNYENQRIEDSEHSFKSKILLVCGICIFVLTVLLVITIFEKNKTKSLKKRIDFYAKQQAFSKKIQQKSVVKDTFIPVKSNSEPSKKPRLISKEKENDILIRLEEFEKSENFLNSDMSLAVLAGQMETNTKYLSEIINNYKGKN